MLKSLRNKFIYFFDKLVLSDIETLRKKHQKDKVKTDKSIIYNVSRKYTDLISINLDTYKNIGFAHVYFKEYDKLIQDLKDNKPIDLSYQEDGVWKDIMLNIYKVKDSKNQTWVLVVDMTNSPNIGLRDYWKV